MTTRFTGSKRKLSVADTLREAQHFAEANQLEESLAVVKGVKALDPRNVYVLAFEKQIEQLLHLGSTGTLTHEQRADILESIPGIVDRAIEGAAVSTPDGATAAPGSPAASKDDKTAALEWLKDQYFQHAHEYVQKGEHEHALAEIRRVYIIDPNNSTAIDFERRVMQLAGIASPGSTVPPSQRQLRLVTRETLANEPPPPEEAEPVLMKTEEWSSPSLEEHTPEPKPKQQPEAQPEHKQQHEPRTRPLPATRRGLRPVTTGVLMLAVLAVGATVYMLWTHQETTKRSEQRRSSVVAVPQQEVFIGAPTVGERSYVVSSASEDSKTGTPEVSEEDSSPIPKEEVKPQRAERRPSRETSTPAQGSSHKATEKQKAAPAKGQPMTSVTEAPPKEAIPAGIAATSAQEPPPERSAPPTPVIQKEAQIIKLERPRFSEAAYAAGISGQVIVQVQIDAQGKPLQTKVLNTNNQLLVTPVIEAVMKSQFAPAQMSSGPVTSWMTIPFKFTSK